MHRGTWSSEDIALQCVSHHFTMSFGELQDCIVWSIKQFQGRGHSCSLHLDVGTQRRKGQRCVFFLHFLKFTLRPWSTWFLTVMVSTFALTFLVPLHSNLRGQKDFIMTANFGLPSVGAENRDAYMKDLVDAFDACVWQSCAFPVWVDVLYLLWYFDILCHSHYNQPVWQQYAAFSCRPNCKVPMSVKFEIPYFTASGVTVRQGQTQMKRWELWHTGASGCQVSEDCGEIRLPGTGLIDLNSNGRLTTYLPYVCIHIL